MQLIARDMMVELNMQVPFVALPNPAWWYKLAFKYTDLDLVSILKVAHTDTWVDKSGAVKISIAIWARRISELHVPILVAGNIDTGHLLQSEVPVVLWVHKRCNKDGLSQQVQRSQL